MNEENIKISVIIPVYNGEKYLERTIKSVINQNCNQLELILVNDGSTDNTPNICDEYSKRFSNIYVLHKENGGISTARNAGMSIAKGEYISFLDADDYMDLNSYDEIINIINTLQPDCIDFGWKYISRSGEITENLNKIIKNTLIYKLDIKNQILPPLLNLKNDEDNFIYDFVCNKIFNRKIINKYGISFDENRRTWEDRVFLVEFLKYTETYYCMDKCFYNYVDIPNSLSRRYDMQYFDIIMDSYMKYYTWYSDEYNFNTEYVSNYWSKLIENMISRSLEQRQNKSAIKNNILEILKNPIVINWFSNRTPNNRFDAKINKLIKKGKVKKVFFYFKIKFILNNSKKTFDKFKIMLYTIKKKIVSYND